MGIVKGFVKKCTSIRNKESYKLLDKESKKHYIDLQKNWCKDNLIRFRFLSARYRAKKKGLLFTITEQDIKDLIILQENKCYYLGEVFDNNSEKYSMSVDRIDSSKGYTRDNIRLISSVINYMKAEYTEEEFFSLVGRIYKLHYFPET